MNFTPGPWSVDDREVQGCDICAPVKGWSDKPVRIAHTMPFANSLATATLIAAAPEMYEALKRMVKAYSGHDAKMHHTQDSSTCAVCNSRAALAKAEGRPA